MFMRKTAFFRGLFVSLCFVGAAAFWGCTPEKQAVVSQEADGESVYRRYCKQCHGMAPPPKFAPPIRGLAIHYREAFSEKEAAVEHMVSFMQKPDPAMSKCRPQAIKRFGLMPAMNVSEEKLRTVSGWVWEQYDPEFKQRHAKEHDH